MQSVRSAGTRRKPRASQRPNTCQARYVLYMYILFLIVKHFDLENIEKLSRNQAKWTHTVLPLIEHPGGPLFRRVRRLATIRGNMVNYLTQNAIYSGNGWTPHENLHIFGKLKVNGDKHHPLYEFVKVSAFVLRSLKKSHCELIKSNQLWILFVCLLLKEY